MVETTAQYRMLVIAGLGRFIRNIEPKIRTSGANCTAQPSGVMPAISPAGPAT